MRRLIIPLTLTLTLTLAFVLIAGSAWAATVYVREDPSNAGQICYKAGSDVAVDCSDATADDTDIEAALAAAGADGTCYVNAGTYTGVALDADSVLRIDEAGLSLIAVGAVTLNGNAVGNVIGLFASGITVDGFNITNGANSGIYISTGGWSNLTITNNNIYSNVNDGISMVTGTDTDMTGFVITGNDIYSNDDWGVQLVWGNGDEAADGYLTDVTFTDNTIRSNGGVTTAGGVRIDRVGAASPVSPGPWTITGNTIYSNSGVGLRIEDLVCSGQTCTVADNEIYENCANSTAGGIWFGTCSYVLVYDNTVYDNHTNGIDGVGIFLDQTSTNNTVYNNIISGHDDEVDSEPWGATYTFNS